jgi:coniferyl-aldehyde dehydrogenase
VFVLDPDPALDVMKEELFGPLLVVRTYRALDECWRAIQAGPRPLGLYVFTHDAETQRAALDQTHSGGVTFNDVLTHASQDDLPFGGIGPSGMGRYRGVEGFREFSHPRAVFHASRVPLQRLSGLVPPFGTRAEQTLARILRGR